MSNPARTCGIEKDVENHVIFVKTFRPIAPKPSFRMDSGFKLDFPVRMLNRHVLCTKPSQDGGCCQGEVNFLQFPLLLWA